MSQTKMIIGTLLSYINIIMDKKVSNKAKTYVYLSLVLIPFCVLFLVYNGKLAGNDFWWHIKVGEWICNNKTLPVKDMFSWYGIENNISWCSQEWLSDVIFYLIFKFSGEMGVYFFCVLSACFLLALIIIHNYKYIRDRILFSLLFLCMAAVCFPCFMYGRPQIFSGILLYIEIRILYNFYKNQNIKTIFLLPVISMLWSNLHGGTSVLSYLICFIFLVSAIIPFKKSQLVNPRKNKNFFIILSVVSVLTCLAIFVNPYGGYVFFYPFENINNGYMQTVILEWNAPDVKITGQLIIYFLPYFFSFLFILLGKRKILFIDVILFSLFLYMFFRSIRFAFLAYIVFSNFVFKYYPKIRVKIEKIGASVTFILIFCLCVYSMFSVIPKNSSDQIIKKVLDLSYCEMIKNDNVKRIFNDYNYGETLIYHNIEVFVDAREDLYANNILNDAIDLLFLTNTKQTNKNFNPDAIIDKYQFDSIIIHNDKPLRAYLDSHSDRYKKIKSDNSTSYYHVLKYYVQ